MVKRLKRFVYETVIPAPGSSRIWSQLQVREPEAANLELAGSSLNVYTSDHFSHTHDASALLFSQ